VPYVSRKQRAKFHVLEDQGKVSHSTVKHWDRESKGKKLPKKKKSKGEGAEAWAKGRARRSS
jgi:hypothetical protein